MFIEESKSLLNEFLGIPSKKDIENKNNSEMCSKEIQKEYASIKNVNI